MLFFACMPLAALAPSLTPYRGNAGMPPGAAKAAGFSSVTALSPDGIAAFSSAGSDAIARSQLYSSPFAESLIAPHHLHHPSPIIPFKALSPSVQQQHTWNLRGCLLPWQNLAKVTVACGTMAPATSDTWDFQKGGHDGDTDHYFRRYFERSATN
jgi:hypothetical protein